MRPHLPIRNQPYKIDINLNGQSAVNKVCLRGILFEGACQIKLTGQHSSISPLRIMLRTSCTQFDADTGRSSVDVDLKVGLQSDGNNRFWKPYEFPKIKVSKAC